MKVASFLNANDYIYFCSLMLLLFTFLELEEFLNARFTGVWKEPEAPPSCDLCCC